jgi:2-aminoadipate transaminase
MAVKTAVRPPEFSALGRRAAPPTIARLMTAALESPGLLSLAAGFTDSASLPVDFVTNAAARLAARPETPEFLQYGTNQGRPLLRRLLAQLIDTEEGWAPGHTSEREIFITNGSQQALFLAMQVLCDPGDLVLVDRPSYFVFLEMLRGLGLEARSLPTDSAGKLDRAALARLLDHIAHGPDRARLKAVYFVSYFSNPSGRSLDETEKTDLAQALAARGIFAPVIEDAAYRQLGFDGHSPSRSILALDAWQPFPRLYTSTLTKPFATGLKVGYGCCSDEAWRSRMLHAKGHHDFGTANFAQALLEEVLADGSFARHLDTIRGVYARKCAALDEALRSAGLRELGWRWTRPAGGLYLWLEAPPGVDTTLDGPFFHACLREGVLYVPGDLCFGDAPEHNRVRLSFGVLAPDLLAAAAERFVAAARSLSR